MIPTHGRAGTLEMVVSPFLADPTVAEVVIVDDGSVDDTPELLASLARSHSKIVIVRQENRGKTAARVAGVERAVSDVLLIIDDDVVLEPGVAAGHLEHHRRSQIPLVVLGYMPNRLPTRRRPGQFPAYVYALDYQRHCRMYQSSPRSVLSDLWGGHLSVRRAVFLAAEAVAEDLPSNEDMVLGWRLAEVGCLGLFDRRLGSVHYYRRSPEKFFSDACRRGRGAAALSRPGLVVAGAGSLPAIDALARSLASDGYSWARWMLFASLYLAGHLHLWRTETAIARVLRHVEGRRAYMKAMDIVPS